MKTMVTWILPLATSLCGFTDTEEIPIFNKFRCNEIHVPPQDGSCPELDQFIKHSFATCLDYNLTAKMWLLDRNTRTSSGSPHFAGYMSAKRGLRRQLVVTLNQYSDLKAKTECRILIEKGTAIKAMAIMRAAARLADLTSASLGVIDFEPKGDLGTR
jgi:hypothetical protein